MKCLITRFVKVSKFVKLSEFSGIIRGGMSQRSVISDLWGNYFISSKKWRIRDELSQE